jgi:hypothetical protein
MCCSSKAFNSKSASGSATCGGGGGSSRCSKKKKKKPSRSLFESSTLPDFYQHEFDVVLDAHTAFEPEETRGVLEAKSTEDVAACAVNRFIEDVLNVPSMTCEKYRKYECSSNEDLVQDADDRACDLGFDTTSSTSTTTSPATCNDKNMCTLDSWDSTKGECIHIPVPCLNGVVCDTTAGCPSCNDKDQCTTNSWDYTHHTCVFTAVDCSSFSRYHQCDSKDGKCKPVCNDDGNKCIKVGWNETIKSCYTKVVCLNGEVCDSAFGCSPNPTLNPTSNPTIGPTTPPVSSIRYVIDAIQKNNKLFLLKQ